MTGNVAPTVSSESLQATWLNADASEFEPNGNLTADIDTSSQILHDESANAGQPGMTVQTIRHHQPPSIPQQLDKDGMETRSPVRQYRSTAGSPTVVFASQSSG